MHICRMCVDDVLKVWPTTIQCVETYKSNNRIMECTFLMFSEMIHCVGDQILCMTDEVLVKVRRTWC